MPKESANGRANRRVASGEWAVVPTSVREKKWRRGKISLAMASFYRGTREREREGRGRSPESVMDTSVESELAASCVGRLPLSRITDRWATVRILKLARAGLLNGQTVSTQSVIKQFLYFPK
jgi:hypothetical protein